MTKGQFRCLNFLRSTWKFTNNSHNANRNINTHIYLSKDFLVSFFFLVFLYCFCIFLVFLYFFCIFLVFLFFLYFSSSRILSLTSSHALIANTNNEYNNANNSFVLWPVSSPNCSLCGRVSDWRRENAKERANWQLLSHIHLPLENLALNPFSTLSIPDINTPYNILLTTATTLFWLHDWRWIRKDRETLLR